MLAFVCLAAPLLPLVEGCWVCERVQEPRIYVPMGLPTCLIVLLLIAEHLVSVSNRPCIVL